MCLSSTWLATISPYKLVIYVLDSDTVPRYQFSRSLNMPTTVAFAKPMAGPACGDSCQGKREISLCISNYNGVFIYRVDCLPEQSHLELILTWKYSPTFNLDTKIIVCLDPHFGVTSGMLTWIQDDQASWSRCCKDRHECHE